MLTITSKLQLDYMQKQKHDLEFEMTVNTNYMNMYTDMLGLVVSDCEKEGYTAEEAKDTPVYKEIDAAATAYEERNDQIDVELELLNEEIQSFEKYHENGIKSDTSFWCFGG
ncbi:hypothetical protein IKE67_03940 [bacterium]|nr:hypothetical protein [bacterium]